MSREKPRIATAEEIDQFIQISIDNFGKIEFARQRFYKEFQSDRSTEKLNRVIQWTEGLSRIAYSCAQAAETDRRGKYNADRFRDISIALMREKRQLKRYLEQGQSSGVTAGVDLDFQALLDKPVKNL